MKEIGSEFSLYSDHDLYFQRLRRLEQSILYLRSGRDAIGYVADLFKMRTGTILLPAYCCESMIDPFKLRGFVVKFYPIEIDLSIAISNLESVINDTSPIAILLMNFYGVSETNKCVDYVKNKYPNIIIIEDITHTIFDLFQFINPNVDFYVGSIRKWLGIYDGALVISNCNLPKIKYIKTEFVELRTMALKIKEEYNHSKLPTLKEEFRRLFILAESTLGNGEVPIRISPESEDLLFEIDVSSIRKKRFWNAKIMLQLLQNIPEVKMLESTTHLLNGTPFCIPILINDRDRIQYYLAENGVYTQILWPLTQEAREASSFAEYIEKSMLSIPIDQRYDFDDMVRVSELLKKAISQ